jgi:hypothetical protein
MNIRGIVEHVMPVVAKLEAAPPDRGDDSPAARAPVFPDDTSSSDGTRDWSNPRLFLPSPPANSAPIGAAAAATANVRPEPRDRAAPVVRAPRSQGPRSAERRASREK